MDKINDVIIVGGGLSGLCVAQFLEKANPEAEVLILEKGDRPGGAIQSFQQDGFLAEWGAHGFLDNIEQSRRLLEVTGLDREMQKAPLADFVRYICLDGELRLIPQNPKKIIASSLIPFTAKLRVLADLWKKPRLEEQTVSRWVEYRFGKALLPFVDAVFTGTYAGDFERLSIDAVMPGVRSIEKEAGSVIRGLIRKQKEARRKSSATRKGLPAMISFPQGMTRLPERLAEGKNIIFNTPVLSLEKEKEGWRVAGGDAIYRAKNVVVALSANQGLQLLEKYSPPVSSLPEARINNVVLGFTDRATIPFGFGYLAPEQEGRFALGALFSTHMFPGRAPEGHVLLEGLVGGRRHPERLDLDDETLIRETYNDLRQLMDLPEPPCYAKVLRPGQGIPQLEMGYPKLLQWRDQLINSEKGLYVCGFGWEGIGMNDMVKAADRIADSIAAGQAGSGGDAEVKGVYF
jgi:oxygen-dependent protoporphyrinogen oxidase